MIPSDRIKYPVFTLQKKTLVESVCSYRSVNWKKMQPPAAVDQQSYLFKDLHWCEKDLALYFEHLPYKNIFYQKLKWKNVLAVMGKIELLQPVVESLEYFKQFDLYTYRHMLLVFALSTVLIQEIYKENAFQIQEAVATPAHDIGKICVPLDILKKSTPLSNLEMEILRHHTFAGYVLLRYYQQKNFLGALVARDLFRFVQVS